MHYTPFTWDPSSPLALTIPKINANRNEIDFEINYSHTGIGCNKNETTALLELLDARDALPNPASLSDLQSLSSNYLSSLQNCVDRWLESSEGEENIPNVSNLTIISSVYHLSVIYLLAPSSPPHHTLQTPGLVTASTVIYLKRNFVLSPLDSDDDSSQIIDELDSASHPEYADAFWNLVWKLLQRGDTSDAWALLSRHSLCQESSKEIHGMGMEKEEQEQTRRGWETLYTLLMEAPLPGYHEGWSEMETIGRVRARWNDWSREVSRIEKGSDGIMSLLIKKIPQLKKVFQILAGHHIGQGWAETLLMELLYKRPTVVGVDMHIRMKCIMRDLNQHPDPMTNVLITIMNGNAGKAIEALHRLGGDEGAALPSTVTALLADLLTLAGKLPFVEIPLRRNLFLSASAACQTSFQSLMHENVGVRCAARLLRISGDVEALAELLGRTFTETDAEANHLLTFLEGADYMTAEEKILLNEAGRDLALSRSNFYRRQNRPGGTVHWICCSMAYENQSSFSPGRDKLTALCQSTAHQLLTNLTSKLFGRTSHLLHWYTYGGEILKAMENEEKELGDGVLVLKNVVKIVHAFEKNDGHAAGMALVDCLEEGESISKASLIMWADLLKTSSILLQREDVQEGYTTELFNVKGIEILMSRLAIVEASPEGTDLLKPEVTEDPSVASFSLEKFRFLLGRGLMRAFVSKNEQNTLRAKKSSQATRNFRAGLEDTVELMLGGPPPIVG